MRRETFAVAGLVLLLSGPAHAQYAQDCRHEGRAYRENARICSGGLELLCSGGTWQNLEGKRCSDRGAYLNPDEYFVVQDPIVAVPAPLPPPGAR